MTAAQMESLHVELEDHEGKTPDEYMESRIVMADREVGVHEAWEEFVSSLTSPQLKTKVTETATVGTTVVDVGEHEHYERTWKTPGAFPTTTYLLARHLTQDNHPTSLSDRTYRYIAFVAWIDTMGFEWENIPPSLTFWSGRLANSLQLCDQNMFIRELKSDQKCDSKYLK